MYLKVQCTFGFSPVARFKHKRILTKFEMLTNEIYSCINIPRVRSLIFVMQIYLVVENMLYLYIKKCGRKNDLFRTFMVPR